MEGETGGKGTFHINLVKTSCVKSLRNLVEYKYLQRLFAFLPSGTVLSVCLGVAVETFSSGDSINGQKLL